MPIYDRSYRRWDGELRRRSWRAWPITLAGVRLAFRPRRTPLRSLLFFGFLLGSQVPFVVLFLLNYAYHFPPENLLPPQALELLGKAQPYRILQYPVLVRFTNPILMIFAVLFGSELIARDRKSLALPLYRSRPLTLADYVLGKLGIVAFFLACVSLLPCLVLWLFNVFAGEAGGVHVGSWRVLGAILGHSGCLVLVYSLTILAASSVCQRPMVAGILWFGGVVVVSGVATALRVTLELENVMALSPLHAANSLAYRWYDLAPVEVELGVPEFLREAEIQEHAEPAVALLALAAYAFLGALLLFRSVKKLDALGSAA